MKLILQSALSILLIIHASASGSTPPFTILSESPKTQKMGYGDWNIFTDGENLIMKHLVEPHTVVFDVGANLGEWTDIALKNHPTITVVSFEPVPQAYKRLEDIFKNNSRVQLWNLALSNSQGSSSFYYYNDVLAHWGLSGFYYREVLHGDLAEPVVIDVPHVSLDDFCQKQGITQIQYLKIDTEGSEWNIIKGAEDLFNAHAIKTVQFEYGGCYKDANTTLYQIVNYLTEKGYVIFRIYSQGLIHISHWSKHLENYDLCNYCAIRSEDAFGYGLVQL